VVIPYSIQLKSVEIKFLNGGKGKKIFCLEDRTKSGGNINGIKKDIMKSKKKSCLSQRKKEKGKVR
jgi:hypothetical protein